MLKDRPWIWVIVAHVIIIAMIFTVVNIAKKYGPKEIPIVQPYGH